LAQVGRGKARAKMPTLTPVTLIHDDGRAFTGNYDLPAATVDSILADAARYWNADPSTTFGSLIPHSVDRVEDDFSSGRRRAVPLFIRTSPGVIRADPTAARKFVVLLPEPAQHVGRDTVNVRVSVTDTPCAPSQELKQLFLDEMDLNTAGSLSKAELRYFLYYLRLTDEEFLRIFNSLDILKNGQVSLDEMLTKLGLELQMAEYAGKSGRQVLEDWTLSQLGRTPERPEIRTPAVSINARSPADEYAHLFGARGSLEDERPIDAPDDGSNEPQAVDIKASLRKTFLGSKVNSSAAEGQQDVWVILLYAIFLAGLTVTILAATHAFCDPCPAGYEYNDVDLVCTCTVAQPTIYIFCFLFPTLVVFCGYCACTGKMRFHESLQGAAVVGLRSVTERIEACQSADPTFTWTIACYHHETRTTGTGKNRRTRTVKVYTHRNSHTDTLPSIDVSEKFRAENTFAPFTRMHTDLVVDFTKSNYEAEYKAWVSRNWLDRCAEHSATYTIQGGLEKDFLAQWSDGASRPWYLQTSTVWLARFFGMMICLRSKIRGNVPKQDVEFRKVARNIGNLPPGLV